MSESWQYRAERAEAEVERLKKWQLEVAEAIGYVNHAEGQDGYEVADAATIAAAWEYVTKEHADGFIDLTEQLEEAEARQENAERDRAKTSRANATLARWLRESTEERDAARASEARLREALLAMLEDRQADDELSEMARAALAGTPSGEPSEYAMRVAEAVREACTRRALEVWPTEDRATLVWAESAIRKLDLAAVVKGVTP